MCFSKVCLVVFLDIIGVFIDIGKIIIKRNMIRKILRYVIKNNFVFVDIVLGKIDIRK